AAARADRLVVDAVAGGGVVIGRPAGHGREHEGRAGAGDLRRLGGAGDAGGQGDAGQAARERLEHGNTPRVVGTRSGEVPGAAPLQADPVTAPFPEDDSPVTKCAPPAARAVTRLSRNAQSPVMQSVQPLRRPIPTGVHDMRLTPLAAALAALLAGFGANAALAQDAGNPAAEAGIAELKAQVAALMHRIEDQEARDEAQSAINIDNAEALKAVQTGQAKVETGGGLKVRSADGEYSMQLGGRLHFDGYAFDDDLNTHTGTSEFRRARLTLSGSARGWDYKIEQDFAAGSNLDGLRDLYIARKIGPGKLFVGHFKPYRSMEELTSSNEILMMERPFASATGLFSGRQFQQGVGYLYSGSNRSAGL